jgi:hypothetical protein
MTPDHVRVVVNGGDELLASAEVYGTEIPGGVIGVCFHAESGHLPEGTRARLVDAVLNLPDVSAGDHLVATVPLGDSEFLLRLGQVCEHVSAHAAGSTALIEAQVPAAESGGAA